MRRHRLGRTRRRQTARRVLRRGFNRASRRRGFARASAAQAPGLYGSRRVCAAGIAAAQRQRQGEPPRAPRKKKGPPANSSLVAIQPKGQKPPLFFVHGVGGGMFWGYSNLSKYLGADQPVFAFKSRGMDGQGEFATIEEMAAQYVADLRAFQPHGPYQIGGYCFGGNVAYEMARQLHAQGETISSLALIDCAPSNCSYAHFRFTPRSRV